MTPPSSAERIVVAAAEVMAIGGWDATTTRIVARRAGVRPGVVHYHFDSIDGLRRQVALQALPSLFGPPQDAKVSSESVERGVRRLFEGLARREWGPARQILVESLSAASRDPSLLAAIGELLAEFREATLE